jgi:hypothetical protein
MLKNMVILHDQFDVAASHCPQHITHVAPYPLLVVMSAARSAARGFQEKM